jgi:leucyl aminopeptidase
MADVLLSPDWVGPTLPILAVGADDLGALLDRLPPAAATFARAGGFDAAAGTVAILPEATGGIHAVLFGLGKAAGAAADPMLPGKLATLLPAGDYRFEGALAGDPIAALAFALQLYRFGRYRKAPDKAVRLKLGAGLDAARLGREVAAVAATRDLINTPANDLGPAEVAAAAKAVAEAFGARYAETVGDELLRGNLPLIHAVGKGSDRAPRLAEFTWGRADAPKVTLVGKGVAFDTGGLDIKPSAGMLLMKKDMGGAANVLGLARLIMGAHLDVRLRVLIPTVENAISGRAMRPSDVYPSRKGLSVEIGNTDAEGRLILADALALADEEAPDLLIDMATLTGAARVALGPDLPPFYTDDDALAADLQASALRLADPLWRLPLWRAYASGLDSKIADLNNVTSGGFAGSVTAALFLSRFVDKAKAWIHLDIYGWTPSAKPGRPEGGEAQGIRALYDVIERRFGTGAA